MVRGRFTGTMLTAAVALALPAGAWAQRTPQNLLPTAPVPASPGEPVLTDTRALPPQPQLVEPTPETTLEARWTMDAAEQLVRALETIDAEGLIPADYPIGELRTALAGGEGDALNAAASRAFAWAIEDLRDGRTPMDGRKQWFVFDPDADRYPTGRLMAEAIATGDVAGAFDRVKPQHPDYALLRDELERTPEGKAQRRKLIAANMDRWRWLPRDLGTMYLMTNVPEMQLRLTVDDQIISTYRTIVGKPGRTATPQLAEMVEGVVFNPTWTVPQSIVVGEGLGAKVLGNPRWAQANGYKGSRGEDGWVSVVQQPGPGNALGLMKLDMPNRHAIFLHDTPNRNLFRQDARALSHGCIRVERAQELAITVAILGNAANSDEARAAAAEQAVEVSTSGEYTKMPVDKELPVYITYFTMARDIDGALSTFRDVYGRDKAVFEAFEAPRKENRDRVTDEQVIPIVDDPREIASL